MLEPAVARSEVRERTPLEKASNRGHSGASAATAKKSFASSETREKSQKRGDGLQGNIVTFSDLKSNKTVLPKVGGGGGYFDQTNSKSTATGAGLSGKKLGTAQTNSRPPFPTNRGRAIKENLNSNKALVQEYESWHDNSRTANTSTTTTLNKSSTSVRKSESDSKTTSAINKVQNRNRNTSYGKGNTSSPKGRGRGGNMADGGLQ